MTSGALDVVEGEVVACRACPRLVAAREAAAAEPPARHRGERYWARPVPGWGDPRARLLVLGLATAAHGGNRTGRVFTGNPTADVLVAALHRAGLASQPTSEHADDGLVLTDVFAASAVRCPPPRNRPTPLERDRCLPFLVREADALPRLRVVLALGGLAWTAAHRALGDGPPRPRFGHGASTALVRGRALVGCYHPSRRNVQTGLLTPAMLDDVLATCRRLVRAEDSHEE